MYNENPISFYHRLGISKIKRLIKPARNGDSDARNQLINLVPPHQQAKLLDEWGIPAEQVSYTELGELTIH
ncbi:MAG: hypothetical protein WEC83_00885 [Patescibacteria group bacterium]